jgi:hypothetical protein
MKQNAISVDMVKDPTKVKPKFIGSFTKRQVVCYGLAAAIGIPFYLLVKDTIGKETAALFMVALMFPFIIASMYEKDGLPAERYFYRFFLWKFIRPVKRNYKKENRFERDAKRKKMEEEVMRLERKQSCYRKSGNRNKAPESSKNRASGDRKRKAKASGRKG